MLRRAILATMLVLCVAGVVRSQQPPSHGVDKAEPTKPQTQAQPDTRGTSDAPIVVKVLPAEKSEADHAREAEEKAAKARETAAKEHLDIDLVRYTSQLADYTLGLFVATAVLVFATIGLLIVTAFQAYQGRAEFNATHRPELVIHSLVPIHSGEAGETVAVIVVYFNKGRGTAKGIERYGYITNRTLPLQSGIEPPQLDLPLADIKAGEKRTLLIESQMLLADAQWSAGSTPHKGPWIVCIGKVVYQDGAGISREIGFAWRLVCSDNAGDWGTERWDPIENSEYQYSY